MIQDDGNLFGVVGHPRAGWLTWLGLRAMRHRAHGGLGVVVGDGVSMRGVWTASAHDDVELGPRLDGLRGSIAVGRLSASPVGDLPEIEPALEPAEEPALRWVRDGKLATAFAGRLSNGPRLRRTLLQHGSALAGTSGAELVGAMIAAGPGSQPVSAIVHALFDLSGAWTLLAATPELVVACRDPRGFRPLYSGRVDGAWAFATESSALAAVGAIDIAEVEPGEVIVAEVGQRAVLRPFLRGATGRFASLIDLAILARPESVVGGVSCAAFRVALGRGLAQEQPASEASMVVGLADALEVAHGYAAVSGRPLRCTIARELPGTPRLLPPPDLGERAAISEFRVIGSPDPIVALVVPAVTTASDLLPVVGALRAAGVKRIHLRVATPPIVESEPYGIVLAPTQLLAAPMHPDLTELAGALDVESVGYLSLQAMRATVPAWSAGWCDTPWSQLFPVPPDEPDAQVAIPFPQADR